MSRFVPKYRSGGHQVQLPVADIAPDPKFEVERIAKALMRPSRAGEPSLLKRKRTPKPPTFSWDK